MAMICGKSASSASTLSLACVTYSYALTRSVRHEAECILSAFAFSTFAIWTQAASSVEEVK